MLRFDSLKAQTVKELKTGIKETLSTKYAEIFPNDKRAPILIKPNLNSNMNALTGNTTDLRVIASVIEFLKDNGFLDITIGEGTNSGFYRSNISVIERLYYDKLAAFYGVRIKDFNYSETVNIEFSKGIKAGVARECQEAALFINMPKLKTHFEAGMSVCLKNLMGCLVGQPNKKKTHASLSENIVNLNLALKPHLHIVDAVIAMEGLGPTRGTPIKTGNVFFGTDPFLIDILMAKFASFNIKKIGPIQNAIKRNIITQEHFDFVNNYKFADTYSLKPPEAGPIATFIHHPKRQKYFLAIRNTAFFNYLCQTEFFGKILFATGLRQDVFIKDEMHWDGLSLNESACTKCGKCNDYCPLDIKLPESLSKAGASSPPGCIQCLYCYSTCPERAIDFHGKLGFMSEQIRQYDNIIRKL
ncbi:MAG: DUF362 domain-containing protein [Nitrospirae bacterium]|nr:DUF362 domain-containing protein [Nitrospirota bacterium]MBF0536233.1 DUF362 domain-containing protein [Nitrospirota bacterium]MBF0617340.1 DUF362 domain-containing protein [Nitrospirota bacterium]